MTFGDEMESAMRTYLAGMGATSMGKISGRMFKEFADEFYAKWQKAHPVKAKASRVVQTNDPEVLIAEFGANPANAGVDVPKEFNACAFWCSENRKILTRARFMNWLINADRTISTAPLAKAHRSPSFAPESLPEPKDWRRIIANDPDDGIFANSNWASLQIYYQKRIARKCENGGCAPSLGQLISFPQTG